MLFSVPGSVRLWVGTWGEQDASGPGLSLRGGGSKSDIDHSDSEIVFIVSAGNNMFRDLSK